MRLRHVLVGQLVMVTLHEDLLAMSLLFSVHRRCIKRGVILLVLLKLGSSRRHDNLLLGCLRGSCSRILLELLYGRVRRGV